MTIGFRASALATAAVCFFLMSAVAPLRATPRTTKQESLDEWRNLTTPTAPLPQVFVKGDHVRFYFISGHEVEVFDAHWTRLRVPTGRYKVSSALVHWNQKLARIPEPEHGWRKATV